MEGTPTYSLAEMLAQLADSVSFILPELVLVGAFLLMIILELVFGKRNRNVVPVAGVIGLLLTGGLVVALWEIWTPAQSLVQGPKGLFMNMIDSDRFGRYFHLLFDGVAILTVLVSMRSKQLRNQSRGLGEYFLVLMAMVVGMHFMSMATNLLMMYLALELVSLPSYILTAYTRLNGKSAEAALKYVIFGSFSSGVMIYGISWLYGMTGSLDLSDPAYLNIFTGETTWTVLFMVILVLAGFIYKIGALPFHFWAPDVYEGAPYPVAAFFTVAPKAAGFAMLIRFLSFLPEEGVLKDQLVVVLGVLAIATMTVGNFAALRQSNFRRMLAYSSIAQAGYILLGVACLTLFGWAAAVFYLTVYIAMNFSSFLLAGWLSEEMGIDDIQDTKGLAFSVPLLGVLLVIFMVALTGLPPTAGFIAKLEIFLSGLEVYQSEGSIVVLAGMIFMVVNTVVSLFYYLRVPARMIFQNSPIKISHRFHGLIPVLSVVFAVLVLWLGIIHFDELINFLGTLVTDLRG